MGSQRGPLGDTGGTLRDGTCRPIGLQVLGGFSGAHESPADRGRSGQGTLGGRPARGFVPNVRFQDLCRNRPSSVPYRHPGGRPNRTQPSPAVPAAPRAATGGNGEDSLEQVGVRRFEGGDDRHLNAAARTSGGLSDPSVQTQPNPRESVTLDQRIQTVRSGRVRKGSFFGLPPPFSALPQVPRHVGAKKPSRNSRSPKPVSERGFRHAASRRTRLLLWRTARTPSRPATGTTGRCVAGLDGNRRISIVDLLAGTTFCPLSSRSGSSEPDSACPGNSATAQHRDLKRERGPVCVRIRAGRQLVILSSLTLRAYCPCGKESHVRTDFQSVLVGLEVQPTLRRSSAGAISDRARSGRTRLV